MPSSPKAPSPNANPNSNVFYDSSGNAYSTQSDPSGNLVMTPLNNTSRVDASGNLINPSVSFDASGNLNAPVIVNYTLNEVVDISGARITNQQGVAADGTEVTQTQFNTNSDLIDLTLNQNLVGVVEEYYNDAADSTSATSMELNKIKDLASKINCTDFQGKGTIEDYSQLFQAASKIANDVKQIELDVNVDGFNEFASAADDLSNLFNSFIVKLQTVSIIDDLTFLQSITTALTKIWNLSEVFGKFKETILATATIRVPKSSHDAAVLVQSVMSEVNCAMTYINHFVNPVQGDPSDANLSVVEQNVIAKAVATIDTWSVLCDQGVSIAMSNNPDIMYISTASSQLKSKAGILAKNTSTLKSKLAMYNINQ